ncbi:MAG: type I CRISPR-associated protein Cas7 [Gordonibacter pamelaeae]
MNSESASDELADKKSSDTMGMKYRVPFGLYLIKGSINCQLAEKTGCLRGGRRENQASPRHLVRKRCVVCPP